MEISQDCLNGLQLSGDAAHIPDTAFINLLETSCDCLLKADKAASFHVDGADAGAVKQAHAAICTFMVEAARSDAHPDSLSTVLEECKYGSDRISQFAAVYTKYKSHLRALLSCTGGSRSHIVDVDWRLDQCLKSDSVDRVNQPSFLINLHTESGTGPGSVQFSCSQEQLQDLVGKLRDACKSMERASQM